MAMIYYCLWTVDGVERDDRDEYWLDERMRGSSDQGLIRRQFRQNLPRWNRRKRRAEDVGKRRATRRAVATRTAVLRICISNILYSESVDIEEAKSLCHYPWISWLTEIYYIVSYSD